ncbi:MAG: hypothetical protein OEV85_01855 [Candidatus Thorarchaeota archaeon]|nr:hypothetical protein [Candidatus Thorarchaeota archaeon]
MKKIIIVTIILATLMLNAPAQGANLADTPEYRLDINQSARSIVLSQEPEYNISSYRDYLEVTADIMINHHMNVTTGRVFHDGGANQTIGPLEETSLASYYWAISALSKAYQVLNNETYRIAMSRAANRMVSTFMDPIYSGYYVNEFSGIEVRQTKRPGVQAYAYWALEIAESTNSSLDFTDEKASAVSCLADMLYDPIYGGFFYYTMRNGSLNVSSSFDEAYPNDGKRLDHLALGAAVLYDAGFSLGNATLVDMADSAMSFMLLHMKYYYEMELMGIKLVVDRSGGTVVVPAGASVGHSIVTDLNAMAIRALVNGYNVTGNATYLAAANQIFEVLLTNNWDGPNGGWYTETVDGVPYDPLEDEDVKYYKYTEIQFQMTTALEDLYEVSDSIYVIRLIVDTLELVLNWLWDYDHEGFLANSNQEWQVFSPEWEIHYTAVQAQAIVGLERIWGYGLPIVSRVRISPTNPRPQDNVDFSVSALDADGIDTVFVNYTMNLGGVETRGILPLLANPQIGGVYNNSIESFEDSTQVNFEVFANDTTGRVFIAGIYYFIVRTDTFPPTVELRAIYPTGDVRAGDDIIIDIETYEFPVQSHTNSCEIWWKLNGGSYIVKNMTPIGIEDEIIIWRTGLGQFNANDQIAFFFLVMDESGNVGESRLYILTVIGPVFYISPWTAFQIVTTLGLVSAPGVGYIYVQRKRGRYREAQREGKKDAKRRARRRGSSRTR